MEFMEKQPPRAGEAASQIQKYQQGWGKET